MIVNRCHELQTLLTQWDAIQKDRQQAEKLFSIQEELSPLADNLEAAERPARLLIEKDILPPTRLPDVGKVRKKLNDIQQKFSESPDRFPAHKTLKNWGTELAAKLEQTAGESWQSYFQKQRPHIDPTQLRRFEQQGGFSQVVARIRLLDGEADRAARRLPENSEQLEQILEDLETLRSEYARLPVADDPEVQQFLDAANAPQGASLDLLTDRVRSWLKDNGLFGDFGIRRN